MSTIQKTWAEVQYKLKNALGTAHGRGGTAGELLKYNDTNRRINNVPQAQWGAFIDLEYAVFIKNSSESPENAARIWAWLPALKVELEKYQLTMDDSQDSRNEFLEAFMYQAKAQSQQGKNTLSIETAGHDGGNTQ
jgi:hypothetical protein